jgi:uncharacterized lipoprotein YajG
MKLTFHVIGILVATVVFAGCSTTNPIVTEWRNPGYSAASFNPDSAVEKSGERNLGWYEK